MAKLIIQILIPLSVLFPWQFAAAQTDTSKPCDTMAGMLVTSFPFKTPVFALPRVEIRQCEPQGSALVQIVAWKLGSTAPGLVINTDDFGVVQAVARENVFVIETGGVTTDQVFVIVYKEGQPQLAVKRVTKGTATVTVGAKTIDIEIDGIYAGNGPPRSERRQFKLDLEQLKSR
jgi:hypothetical protein